MEKAVSKVFAPFPWLVLIKGDQAPIEEADGLKLVPAFSDLKAAQNFVAERRPGYQIISLEGPRAAERYFGSIIAQTGTCVIFDYPTSKDYIFGQPFMAILAAMPSEKPSSQDFVTCQVVGQGTATRSIISYPCFVPLWPNDAGAIQIKIDGDLCVFFFNSVEESDDFCKKSAGPDFPLKRIGVNNRADLIVLIERAFEDTKDGDAPITHGIISAESGRPPLKFSLQHLLSQLKSQ
jgi:hypothetical protein